MQVRYLKIIEKSGYQALPWVRYITMAGEYELRLIWVFSFLADGRHLWSCKIHICSRQQPYDIWMLAWTSSADHTRFPPGGLLFLLLGSPYLGYCTLPIKYRFGKKERIILIFISLVLLLIYFCGYQTWICFIWSSSQKHCHYWVMVLNCRLKQLCPLL